VSATEATFLEIGPTVPEAPGEATVASCIGHQPYQMQTMAQSGRRVVFANHSGVEEMSGNRLITSSPLGVRAGEGNLVLEFESAPVEWTPGAAGRSLRDAGIDQELLVSVKGDVATVQVGDEIAPVESRSERHHNVPVTVSGGNERRSESMALSIRNHGTITALTHPRQLLFPQTPVTKRVASKLADSKSYRAGGSEWGRKVIVHDRYDVIGISKAGGES